MADSDFSVKARINADTSNFDKGMKDAQNSANSLSNTFSNLQSTINNVFKFAGIAVGTKALFDFGKKAVSAADDANRHFKMLESTIKVTGASSWTSSEDLENMAKSYAKSTNYSVTEVEKMQTVLLGFKNISGDTFKSASDAILDMSSVMGMDLTSAVQTVGKALDDPVKGLDSLRRQGFAFTDEQKEELAQLVKNGEQMKAQQIILNELATTYGGAAQEGQSAFAQFQHSMDDVYETIGNKLMPIVNSFMSLLAKLGENIAKFLNSSEFNKFATILAGVLSKVKDALSNIINYISNVFTEIKEIFAEVDFSPFLGIIDTVIGLIQAVFEKAKEMFDKTKEQFKSIMSSIVKTINPEQITNVINKIIDVFWYLYDMLQKIQEQIREKVLDKIMEAWEWIKGLFEESNNALAESGYKISSWVDYIYYNLNNAFKMVQDFFGLISALINGDWSVAWEYAKLMFFRFCDGILTSLSTVLNAFPSLLNGLIDGINSIVEGINKLRKLVGESPYALIEPFKGIDLSEEWGVSDAIEEIENNIKEMTGKTAEVSIKELTGISDKSKGVTEQFLKDMEKTSNASKKTGKDVKNNIGGGFESSEEKLSDFDKALKTLKKTFEEESEGFDDFFVDTFGTMQSMGISAISSIGSALVEGEDVWKDMGAVAVESIASILEGLSKELMARAALNASMMNYAGAAAAMAGATAALVGAGALKAVANQMKSVADSAKEANVSVENIKNNFNDILKNTKDFGSFASGFTGLQKTLSSTSETLSEINDKYGQDLKLYERYKEMQSMEQNFEWRKDDSELTYVTRLVKELEKYKDVAGNIELNYKGVFKFDGKEVDSYGRLHQALQYYFMDLYQEKYQYVEKNAELVKKTQQAYEEALKNLNSYSEQVLISFKESNQDLIDVINVMDLFLSRSNAGDNMGKIIGENIKSGILNSVYDARNSLIGMGSELSNLLFSSISEGSTKSSFLSEMKNYIKESVLKLTVYTEGLAESMSSISQKIISAIYSGDVNLAKTAKNDVKKLWDETKEMAKQAEGFVNEIFDEIEDNAESLVDTIEDMVSTIGDEIVNALSESLTQGDFLETMKNYIRKMVIQTVVYTESLKTEIEAIGKAISTGIAEGFTETGLHEIKRDLSYVFDQATRAMDKVDNLFNNVFSGYATGTNNATAGLHLVGEAGPELVRFRGGEQVLNTANTQKALEGSAGNVNNWTVNFNNMQDTSAYVMMEQLKDYRRQMAIDGIF
jgi:phage-related protein